MVNYFSIALTHGLILLAAWRMMARDDLDRDAADEALPKRPWLKDRSDA